MAASEIDVASSRVAAAAYETCVASSHVIVAATETGVAGSDVLLVLRGARDGRACARGEASRNNRRGSVDLIPDRTISPTL